jgi:hypothetical protein
MERNLDARRVFENKARLGIRPKLYCLDRLAGGEYVSVFTEMAWKDFLAGWTAAVEEYCD